MHKPWYTQEKPSLATVFVTASLIVTSVEMSEQFFN